MSESRRNHNAHRGAENAPPGDRDAGASGLAPKQEAAILALLAAPTVKRAAESCRVPERTLYRWLRDPAFAAAYRAARRESFGQAVGLAQQYASVAINTLAKLMNDRTCPASAKVAAATNMLRFARESIELDELVGRIETLEAAGRDGQKQQEGGPKRWQG